MPSIGGFLGHCETGVSSAPVDVGGFLTINAPSESCSVLIWPKVFAPGRAAPWLAELTRRSLTFALGCGRAMGISSTQVHVSASPVAGAWFLVMQGGCCDWDTMNGRSLTIILWLKLLQEPRVSKSRLLLYRDAWQVWPCGHCGVCGDLLIVHASFKD